MKRSAIVNAVIFIFSTLLAFLLAEFIYQGLLFSKIEKFEFLRNPAFYAVYYQDENEDFYNEDYWKLNFLFGKGFEINEPHPELGWAGYFNKTTYKHWYEDSTAMRNEVLFYGNSFTMCIDSVKCFEDYLNKDSLFSKNHYMYNYGVGGYGVDQISLLLKESIDNYSNPFVVLGILTTDIDRSMLKIRDAPKPYFILENDSLKLQGVPVTETNSSYISNHPPKIHSYILNRMYNIITRRLDVFEEEKRDYIESIKSLNAAILKRTFDQLKSKKINFLVLIFQPGEHNPRDWRLTFLQDLCLESEVPFVSNLEIINMDMGINNRLQEDYYVPLDGHPNSLANMLVAEEIKKFALDSNYFYSLKNEQKSVSFKNHGLKVKNMEYQIYRDNKRLNRIRKKAQENNISVDSQVNLDVIYILNQPKDSI